MDNKRSRDLGFIFFGVIPTIICLAFTAVSLIGKLYVSDEEKLQAAIASVEMKTAIEQAKIEAAKIRGNLSPEGLAANTIHIATNCKQ